MIDLRRRNHNGFCTKFRRNLLGDFLPLATTMGFSSSVVLDLSQNHAHTPWRGIRDDGILGRLGFKRDSSRPPLGITAQ